MTDAMPSTYTTSATSTTRTVFFDKGMLRRREVILKIAEIVFCLVGMISVANTGSPWVSEASFYYFIASVGVVVALILLVIYVTHIRDKIAPTLRLNFVEMLYSAVWCIFFVAGSIAAIVFGQAYAGQTGMTVAGVFGLVLSVLYALETYYMYLAWRTGATMSATQTTTRQVA